MSETIYSQLHNAFHRLLSEYASVYEVVKANNDWKNSFRDIVVKEIPELLRISSDISDPYTIVGSYGKGRWTAVPWIAVFDTRITASAQKGVYVVYLLNKDTKELYLSFAIAAAEALGTKTNADGKIVFAGIVGNNSPALTEKLQGKAESIRAAINDDYFCKDGKINSGAPGYDAGTVYYMRYSLDSLPEGEVLAGDLDRMMKIYKRYYDWISGVNSHSYGTFDSWEIIDENAAVKHCDKSFFEHNGSGVPKGICWFFDAEKLEQGATIQLTLIFNGAEYTGRISNESSDRRRVRIFWNSDLGKEFAKFRTDDVSATFTRISNTTYEISFSGGEKEVLDINTKDALAEIKSYIFARGFDYPDGLIENFYLSLKSKPFVILAGTSGTGKTRLVKLFAEAIGAAFKLVSVRPDWSDGSDLFGHTDLNGNFIPGPVCSAFEAALADRSKPVFLCLDEMNLARVEYYLSDFLSVIESREKENGHIVTEGIAQYEEGIPENLYIIGTVNMDETTFPFSKKVLDRANTIEFSYVDLMPKQRTGELFAPQELPNSFLCTEYLVLAADCMEDKDLVEKICTELQVLNGKLVKANAHVGFRVRDEIVFYMLNNEKSGNLLTYEQAMDNEIMQKILPRIQGSSAAIKTLLIDMFRFCMGSGSGIDADTGNVGEQMKNAAASAKYPESAKKIGYMMTRFEDDGFTSYWL